nr:hypothetical protein [Tanacetum cinerariifolium]
MPELKCCSINLHVHNSELLSPKPSSYADWRVWKRSWQQKFNLVNQGNNRNIQNSCCNSNLGNDLSGNDSHNEGMFQEMPIKKILKQEGTLTEYCDAFKSLPESIGMGNGLVAEVLVGTVKESKDGVECKEVSDCVMVLDDRCEKTESKDYEDGGEMDLGFKGNLNSLVEHHERNICERSVSISSSNTTGKEVGKDRCARWVGNKDEYGVKQDACREYDDFLVSDLVLGKYYDWRNFEGQACGYTSFSVFAFDPDVHNSSTKSPTYEDDLYMNERKTENSEMGSAILKFDIWKWPKRKKQRYTN